jgi:hydrophobe/amphiphile efflux-3 (HAE3) family protein
MKKYEKLLYLGIDYPKLTIAFLVMLTLVVGTGAIKLKHDTSTDSFIPRGHSSYDAKMEIEARFNIDDPLLVNVRSRTGQSIFNVEGLRLLRDLTDYVSEIDGVNRETIRSLTTKENIVGTEDGLEVNEFLEQLPSSQEEAIAVREAALNFPLYVGLIVSNDGKSAGIVADVNEEADILAIFDELKRYIKTNYSDSDYEINLSGPPIVTGTLNVYLNQDAMTLDPICALITSLILFLIFRTLRGIVLPLVVVLPSVVWCLGLMGFLDYRFTPFSNALPVVILAAAIADSMHIIGDFYDSYYKNQNQERHQILKEVLHKMWKPIVMTSVTTSIGFLMLTGISPIIPVQQFGVIICVGILVAMFFSLYFLPAILMLTKVELSEKYINRLSTTLGESLQPKHGLLMRILHGIYKLVSDNARVIFIMFFLIAGVGIYGLTKLYYDYETVTYFPKNSDVVKDYTIISQDYVGTHFIEIQVDSGQEDGVFELDFLRTVDAFQTEIEKWDQIGNTISLVDFIKKMNKEYHGGDPNKYTVADTVEQNAQYFFLYQLSGDPTTFDEFVDSSQRYLNMRLFLKKGSYKHNREFIQWLEQNTQKYLGAYAYKIGGESYVTYNWMETVGQSVIFSILFMTVVVIFVSYLGVRSLGAAVLMSLPVNTGIFMTYAMMGYLGIFIGLGTSIFASIAIGIGIDFAIHFVMRYRYEFERCEQYKQSIYNTLMGSGKLIFFNACIITLGFLVLVFAKTQPPAQMGLFVAITVFASLLMTYFILGYMLRFVKLN